MNILIIEDDLLLRKALSHRLLDAGHTVSAAGNGKEAMAIVEKNSAINLIVCDLLMPEISGPTLILMLKKHFREKFPVIVIISAVKDAEAFLEKLEIGYDHFLPKPVDFNKLDNIIAGIAI
jgi:CheY-like chemotaxis protein